MSLRSIGPARRSDPSFQANPDALVILSIRSTESWYTSASNTIMQVFEGAPPEMRPWFEKVIEMLGARFCNQFALSPDGT